MLLFSEYFYDAPKRRAGLYDEACRLQLLHVSQLGLQVIRAFDIFVSDRALTAKMVSVLWHTIIGVHNKPMKVNATFGSSAPVSSLYARDKSRLVAVIRTAW